MPNVFLISDTHFGHVGVTKFLRNDGTKLRPWDTIEEMDEALVSNWNSVVKPDDRVYHLGDVVMNRRALSIVGRLNGRKILIKGNHDTLRIDEYTPFFDDIRAYHILDNMLLCHVPVHPYSKNRFKANVHGHTHADIIPDPWYIPVSVEQINYTPISLEEVRKCVS